MHIISKHLDIRNLKRKVHQIETIDAFTGEPISEGVKIDDLLSDVFTDWEYLKHNSGYVGTSTALCIAEVIPGKTKNNSLRSYSYYASNSELRLLNRQDCLELIMNIPETTFRIAISYNNKKHTSYKTVENMRTDVFTITTDLYNVGFVKSHVERFLPIIKNWYSIVPEKANTATPPTYFTKDEILHGNANYPKQVAYGLEKFEQENEFLQSFRNTQIFELIVHLLNKK